MSFEFSGATAPLANPSISLTTDQAAVQITRDNISWGTLGHAATVSFAFRANDATYDSGVTGFSQFNAQQIAAATLSFQAWSDVANITFNRVGSGLSGPAAYSDNAQILLSDYSGGRPEAAAFAYSPGANQGGDVWVNRTLDYNASPTLWNYGQMTLTHEIGHAIGLEHPGDYDASDDGDVTYDGDAAYREDSRQYSIMSYFSETETGADFHGNYAAAPLLDDIAAAQRLYGANMTTCTGDTVYGFHATADRTWYQLDSAGDVAIFCVWDAGGSDTLDFSGYAGDQFIDLHAESFSDVGGLEGNVSIARGAVIENAILGAGGGGIWGNEADNRLVGGFGSDGLYGYEGNDTLVSGASWGTDTYDGGEGIDTIDFSELRHGASANLSQSGVGGGKDVEIVIGTSFTDYFTSTETTLVLQGRQGDDTFIRWFDGETIDGGAGVDTLSFSADAVTFDLATAKTVLAIENLTGSLEDDVLSGNAKDNVINGMAGDDTLQGGGGADSLDGGGSIGTDMVSFSLADGGVSVDLSLNFGVGADGATLALFNIEEVEGSAYADVIKVGQIHGRLFGGGGADVFLMPEELRLGSERVQGGGGVDTLSFDPATQGITATLGVLNREVENLVGSGFDDVLGGDGGANKLSGGAGVDLLAGGLGDDVMIGGQGEDTVSFAGAAAGIVGDLARHRATGDGADKIKSVENLVGSGQDDGLTGDLNVNRLDGGEGADTLAGGFGADILTGGSGADVFLYGKVAESAPAAADLITDLEAGDHIDLSRIDADAALRGNQAFALAAKFTGHAGQLVVRYDAKHDLTTFSMDVDGDRVADMAITASGDHHAFAGFVL